MTESSFRSCPLHGEDSWCAACGTPWVDHAAVAPRFQPGDLADHKGGHLDPRTVESVEGDRIRLRIGSLVTEPVPASNYRRIPRPTHTKDS